MVTWLGLLSALGIIAGTCLAGFSVFMMLAEGMSDAPSEGSAGCVPMIVGLVLIAAGVLVLVL